MRGMKTILTNLKCSKFRNKLLENCRESFQKLINQPDFSSEKRENETEEDRQDREFKMKHKLLGNIDFVGELYKETLITDPIINSVFECLMGYGENGNSLTFNDNTVEAALNLVNKNWSHFD